MAETVQLELPRQHEIQGLDIHHDICAAKGEEAELPWCERMDQGAGAEVERCDGQGDALFTGGMRRVCRTSARASKLFVCPCRMRAESVLIAF
jgi:hypothetical protein